MQYSPYFAQTYNTCPYGSGNFNSQTNTGTTSCAGTTTTATGGLVNTGFIVLAVVVAAAVLIFIALLVRFVRRPSKPVGAKATTPNGSEQK